MRISLLEDDLDQSEIVTLWLETAGHGVTHFGCTEDFLHGTMRESFDLHILDWMLGQSGSGLDMLKELRRQREDNTPVIFVTVKSQEHFIVTALDAGADDYIVKPLRRSELVARVNALGRRAGLLESTRGQLEFPPYTFDLERREVRVAGVAVALTHREYELALFLFRRAGTLVSRQHVLEEIWGLDQSKVYTRTVDTHVSRIRKKLNIAERTGWTLTSVYQHGYRLEAVEDRAPDPVQDE